MVAREFTRYQKSFKLLDWDSRGSRRDCGTCMARKPPVMHAMHGGVSKIQIDWLHPVDQFVHARQVPHPQCFLPLIRHILFFDLKFEQVVAQYE